MDHEASSIIQMNRKLVDCSMSWIDYGTVLEKVIQLMKVQNSPLF